MTIVSCKKYLVLCSSTTGATMIEFALASMLFIGLIGAIFDLGVGFHKYNIVNHGINKVARDFAIQVTTDPELTAITSCNGLRAKATERAKQYFDETLAMKTYISTTSGELQFMPEFDLFRSPKTFRLTGRLTLQCYLCAILPKNMQATAVSEAVIERTSFTCTGS